MAKRHQANEQGRKRGILNKPKKYFVKVKYYPSTDQPLLTYHTNDLLKFTDFLDKRWAGWRFMNVCCNKSKLQIANFTNKNRPINKDV